MRALYLFIHEGRLKSNTFFPLNPVLPTFFFSLAFFMDCEPAGGPIVDAFLWRTKVIQLRRYESLSKADMLLKNYSPHEAQ